MINKSIIFGIYGVSASGKSTLLKIFSGINSSLTIHKKDTTRRPDPKEDLDEKNIELNFLSKEEFMLNKKNGIYETVYYYSDHFYGIQKEQILNAYSNKTIHCIIVRDINTIKLLKKTYLNFKSIYFHVDPENVPEFIKRRDRLDSKTRALRIKEEFNEFVENNTLFDHIIVNFWNISNAVKQFQNIINHYSINSHIV